MKCSKCGGEETLLFDGMCDHCCLKDSVWQEQKTTIVSFFESEKKINATEYYKTQRDILLAELKSLCNYVNAVTVFHRHGNKIPEGKLDNLVNKHLTSESIVISITEESKNDI